jgi:hypothetical protein
LYTVQKGLIMTSTRSAATPSPATPSPAAASPVAAVTPAGRTASLLVAGAVTVNLAFLGLGSVFDYPEVLNQPPADVLVRFHENPWVIGGLFLLLAAGAALLAPIAVAVARLGGGRALRASRTVGIAAAAVQVIGLLRWPLVVPFLAGESPTASAAQTFDTLNLVLGTTIGETIGYALTAAWTVLVCVGLHRTVLGRALTAVGILAAALIAIGTVEPLVPSAGLANFIGYVVWSAWLVAFAVLLLVRRRSA